MITSQIFHHVGSRNLDGKWFQFFAGQLDHSFLIKFKDKTSILKLFRIVVRNVEFYGNLLVCRLRNSVLQNNSGDLATAKPAQLIDFEHFDYFLAILAFNSEPEPELYFLTFLSLPYAHPHKISGITK